ncbi:MAG: DUF1080 domain-containing protein [Planctomycetes bacterium]|nr:DUF1080 domain-containing protein [Planctomycetota bacterium]
MYGVTRFGQVVSVLSLLSLMFGAGSCAGTQTGVSDLLTTGLVGWQQIGGQERAWQFEKDILSVAGEQGGWLATHREYSNFGLQVEFRVPPGGTGGVLIRAPLEGDPAYTGLRIQIRDDYAPQGTRLEPYQYTGSIYGIQAPSERVSKKAGQWQRLVVIARGVHIQVGLNGKKILDTDLSYYTHMAPTHPGLLRSGGHIGLQSLDGPIEFRGIKLRELPER